MYLDVVESVCPQHYKVIIHNLHFYVFPAFHLVLESQNLSPWKKSKIVFHPFVYEHFQIKPSLVRLFASSDVNISLPVFSSTFPSFLWVWMRVRKFLATTFDSFMGHISQAEYVMFQ